MKLTNYDTSSSGADVEISIFYDTDLARHEFEEAFEIYSYDNGWHSTCRVFYTAWGGTKAPSNMLDFLDLSEVAEKEARDWLIDYKKDGGWYTARDIVADKREHYYNWKDFLEDTLVDIDIKEAFDEDKIPSIGVPKYESVGIRGYSKGDYAEVMYEIGEFGDKSNAIDLFKRLFYDAPVYGHITVDGEEYLIDEFVKDNYVWDVDEVKTIVDGWDIPDSAKEFIKENLPEYPSYS